MTRWYSLRARLFWLISIPLVIFVAIDTATLYQSALKTANLAYDRSLLATARSIAEHVNVREGKLVANPPWSALEVFDNALNARLYYRVSGFAGEHLAGSTRFPPVPARVERAREFPALAYFHDAMQGEDAIRAIALYQPINQDGLLGLALVQVGETMDERRGQARGLLREVLLRQTAFIALAVAVVLVALSFALKPLNAIGSALAARKSEDFSALEVAVLPRETAPLFNALQSYLERLQALVRSRERFLADASHQLRTPLALIKLQAQVAQSANGAERDEALAALSKSADQAARLADQLLSAARTAHREVQAVREPCELRELARELCSALAPRALEREMDLSLEAESPLQLVCDPLLIYELLANLVDNAIRHCPSGATITVRLSSAAGFAKLSVEDNGPGMSEEARDRAFQRFNSARQASNSTAGSGLGLAIAKQIALAHGGELLLLPRQPQGLAAELRLPIHTAAK